MGQPHHEPPHPPPLAVPGEEGQEVHGQLVRPGDVAELLPPPEVREHFSTSLDWATGSPGHYQRHVEAQHEGDGDPVVEVSKVDADLLKVLFHHLVLEEVETVEEADAEVEEPEEEEIAQDPLVDAAFPEAEQSEEGSTLARGVDMVDVGHRHPQSINTALQ